jgi:hypothetical protein
MFHFASQYFFLMAFTPCQKNVIYSNPFFLVCSLLFLEGKFHFS